MKYIKGIKIPRVASLSAHSATEFPASREVFMKSQALFIVKLLIVSAALSVAIKFVPIAIAPTTTNVLIAVLLPTIVMTVTFLVRYANISQQKT